MKTIVISLVIHLTALRLLSSAHKSKNLALMKDPHLDWSGNYGTFNIYKRGKLNPRQDKNIKSQKDEDSSNEEQHNLNDGKTRDMEQGSEGRAKGTTLSKENYQYPFGKKSIPSSKHIIKKRWSQSGHDSYGSHDHGHNGESKDYESGTKGGHDHYGTGGINRHSHHSGHRHRNHGASYKHNSRGKRYRSHGSGLRGYNHRKGHYRHGGHGRSGGYGHRRHQHHK